MVNKTKESTPGKARNYPWVVIESLRARKGISKKTLSEKLGFSYGYLVDLLNGRYSSKIDNQSLEIISEVLGIPLEHLVLQVITPEGTSKEKSGVASQESRIPLIPLNSGTHLGALTEEGLRTEELDGYLTRLPELSDPYAFGIRLWDEAMRPPCPKGSVFVVSPQQSAQIGVIVLIILTDGRAWVGELKEHTPTQSVLRFYNPNYALVTLAEHEIAFIYPVVWLLFPNE